MEPAHKFIVLADVHLDNSDKWGRIDPATNVNSRVVDKLRIVRSEIDFANEKKVDFVVFLGDTFDSPRPPLRVKRLFYEELTRLESTPVLVLGNHEISAFENAYTSDSVLFATYNKKQVIVVSDIFEHKNFLFLSFLEDPVEYIDRMKDKVVFWHGDVMGAKFSEKVISDRGVSVDVFATANAAFLGHYHLHHQVGNSGRNVWYVGSPARCNFGEKGQEKGFLYCQDYTDHVEFSFIPTKDRPFIELNISGLSIETDYSGIQKDAVYKITFSGSKDFLRGQDVVEKKKEFRSLGITASFEDDLLVSSYESGNGDSFALDENVVLADVFGADVGRAKEFLLSIRMEEEKE
jgi:DNA repair exonuclease SbcCD nuclease subunit